MINAFLLRIAEWALEKTGHALMEWIRDWLKKRSDQKALKKNKANKDAAIESGDINAIEQAGKDSLNNIP